MPNSRTYRPPPRKSLEFNPQLFLLMVIASCACALVGLGVGVAVVGARRLGALQRSIEAVNDNFLATKLALDAVLPAMAQNTYELCAVAHPMGAEAKCTAPANP